MPEEISKEDSKPRKEPERDAKKEHTELSAAQKRLKKIVWTMRAITVIVAIIFVIYLYFWVKRHSG